MSIGAGGLADRIQVRWHRADPWAVTTMVVALAFLVFVAVLAIVRADVQPRSAQHLAGDRSRGDVGSPTRAEPDPRAIATSLPGIDVHVNDRAGYLFSFPSDWDLETTRERDELVDPTGQFVLVFGEAPPGPLAEAAGTVLDELSSSYADLDVVTRSVERTEQGQRGLLVGATATDAEGNPMQLMAITIRGPDHNRAIIARFPSSAATEETIADLQQIIGSFRTAAA